MKNNNVKLKNLENAKTETSDAQKQTKKRCKLKHKQFSFIHCTFATSFGIFVKRNTIQFVYIRLR